MAETDRANIHKMFHMCEFNENMVIIKKNAGTQGRISTTVAELVPNTGNPLDPPPPSSRFTYISSKSKQNFTIKQTRL